MSKIKILAIIPDQFGVGKFRVLDPFRFIGDNYYEEFHVDLTYDTENVDETFLNYNIVVFHSFIHKLPHEVNVARIKWLKEKGIITIMDIDDLWFVDQRHPLFHHIKNEGIDKKKAELLRLSDYVTTTTPIFAKTLKERLGIKNVLIFPNAINPEEKQFQPNPIPSDKIRFGWLGGSTHLHDLELMSNGLSSIYYSHKEKVQLVLCGFDLRGNITEINKETGETTNREIRPEETVWYQYEKFFTDNYKILDKGYETFLKEFKRIDFPDENQPYRRRWTEDVSKYATNYNYFDISLAPLVESMFNANKSQLKVIEAGFHKKALIASEVEPYTLDLIDGVNALLVSPRKNHKQWAKHMKKLADNPELVKELSENLYNTVKDKYSLQKVCKDRVEFFKTLINKN